MAKLKVYRTAIGFHDAYVAATSQKAALEAWGADSNLFAHGIAEVVTDPKLIAEPLASPGKIIKRSRGDLSAQLAALKTAPETKARKYSEPRTPTPAPKPRRPTPRPKRDKLDRAESEMRAFENDARKQLEVIRQEEAALRKRRAEVERNLERERGKLDDRVARAAERYEQALNRWRRSE